MRLGMRFAEHVFLNPRKLISASPAHNCVAPCLVPHRWRRDAFGDAFGYAFRRTVVFFADPLEWIGRSIPLDPGCSLIDL